MPNMLSRTNGNKHRMYVKDAEVIGARPWARGHTPARPRVLYMFILHIGIEQKSLKHILYSMHFMAISSLSYFSALHSYWNLVENAPEGID